MSGTAIAMLALGLEFVVVLVGAVWVVAQIKATAKGTSDKLGLAINNLAERVSDLGVVVRELDTKVDHHSERLARIEGAREKERSA